MASSRFSDIDISSICEQYSKYNKSTIDLAAEYKCSSETIRKILKDNNINRRETRSYIKNNINENYFKVIDSPQKAYWLGFLTADGQIGKSQGIRKSLMLSISSKDGYLVKWLAEDLEKEGKLYHDESKFQTGISVCNKVLADSLISKGFLDWKYYGESNLFGHINSDLIKYFIHGFFDGDGCISAYFSGSKKSKSYYIHFAANKKHIKVLEHLSNFISKELNFEHNIVNTRSNSICLVWKGNKQVEKFGDWIYSNPVQHFLKRKYSRYLAVKNRDLLHYWRDIFSWKFKFSVGKLKNKSDIDNIIDRFTDVVINGFVPQSFKGKSGNIKLKNDLIRLKNFNYNNYIKDNKIIISPAYGNKIIINFQPLIWSTALKGCKPFSELSNYRNKCRGAVKALLTTGKKIYPDRLIRELRLLGISRASLLSATSIICALKYFNLSGKWFDPCAGWGTRLLTAKILQLDYEGIDPARHYYGLVKIQSYLKTDFKITRSRFEDYEFPSDASFVFTSPPFYNKEDYGLNDNYGTFEDWYQNFLVKLVNKCLIYKDVVFHVDSKMCTRLEEDFALVKVPYITGNRLHAPQEWFIKLNKK